MHGCATVTGLTSALSSCEKWLAAHSAQCICKSVHAVLKCRHYRSDAKAADSCIVRIGALM